MRYVRIDENNTHNLMINYALWPYDDEFVSKTTKGFLTSYSFADYDEAAEVAMKLLRDPKEVISRDSLCKDKPELIDTLSEDLEKIDGYFISECLCIFDEDWTCIDCPVEYIYSVGQVFKEDKELDAELNTATDEKLS